METRPVKTRFAPSPTGRLHLGNVRTALFNALLARRHGGRFLLRIEDTDRDRSSLAHEHVLLEELRWLGLDWDEGPGAEEPPGGARQSERGAIYDRYFDELLADGRAYHCFCDHHRLRRVRAEQRAAGRPPRYDGACAGLTAAEARERVAAGEPATLRFRVPTGETVAHEDLVRGEQRFDTDAIGDFVIRRADGTAAFFFSNALDDALMGVTHVLRGEDHLANTPRQCLLLTALGLRSPAYGHFGLIVGADGAPLSKRHGGESLEDLRAAGYLPEAIVNYLARLGHRHGDDEPGDVNTLAAGFDVTRIGRSPAHFDLHHLDHWQALAVARAPLEDWLDADCPVPAEARDAFIELVRPNVRLPRDVHAWARRLFGDIPPDDEAEAAIREAGPVFFRAAVAALDTHPGDWNALAGELKQRTGCKGRSLFMPLRAALTGAVHGPELAGVLRLLPTDEARRRLQRAAATDATNEAD